MGNHCSNLVCGCHGDQRTWYLHPTSSVASLPCHPVDNDGNNRSVSSSCVVLSIRQRKSVPSFYCRRLPTNRVFSSEIDDHVSRHQLWLVHNGLCLTTRSISSGLPDSDRDAFKRYGNDIWFLYSDNVSKIVPNAISLHLSSCCSWPVGGFLPEESECVEKARQNAA